MKLQYTKEAARLYFKQFDDLRIEGATPFEEVYTHQKFGSFAVAQIMQCFKMLTPEEQKQHTALVAITDEMRLVVANGDVSMERVEKMPPELPYQKPCLFLQMEDGTYLLGDGLHRPKRLLLDGATEVPAILAPHEVVKHFRVKVMVRRRDTREWELLDPDADLAMMQGEFFHHQFYGGK